MLAEEGDIVKICSFPKYLDPMLYVEKMIHVKSA